MESKQNRQIHEEVSLASHAWTPVGIQTNDIQNWYLSLPSLALDIKTAQSDEVLHFQNQSSYLDSILHI